jgi:hypothetical protein
MQQQCSELKGRMEVSKGEDDDICVPKVLIL